MEVLYDDHAPANLGYRRPVCQRPEPPYPLSVESDTEGVKVGVESDTESAKVVQYKSSTKSVKV